MADEKGSAKRGRAIGMRGVLIAAALITAGVCGAAVWRFWPATHHYYTDADSIREPQATAVVRDILWQPPKRIEGLLNTALDDYEPRISADGMTLYFVRGKAGENADIYTSERTVDGWSEPTPLDGVNSEYDELGPCISSRDDTLYFYSDRPGGAGGYDLWVAYRSGGQTEFGEPTNLGPNVNSPFSDYGPAISPDGDVLYFASNRPQEGDGTGPDPDAWPATIREDLFRRDYDLYHAAVTDAGVGKAAPLTELNTPRNEGVPAVTPAGDFLYFASDRQGGSGGFDLYRSWRLNGGHEPATNLGPAVNTPANELDPSLGMGGFGLYFSSDRATAGATGEGPRDYNLYYTASREVFALSETQPVEFDFAALWDAIGLNLLLALLALLLALLLLRLMRGVYGRRLSLLARCLLASMLLHLLLLFLFTLWQVTTGLADTMRRGSGVHITLAAPATSDGIAAQIRGGMTSVDVAAPEPAVVRREPIEVAFEAPTELANVSVTTHAAPSPEQANVEPIVTDARQPTAAATPEREVDAQPSPTTPLAMSLPDQPARAQEVERTPDVPAVQPTEVQRAESEPPTPTFDAPTIADVTPAPVDTVDPASRASLVNYQQARESQAPRNASIQPDVPQVRGTPSEWGERLSGEVALPKAPEATVTDLREASPKIPSAAMSPTRASFVDRKPEIDTPAPSHVAPAAAQPVEPGGVLIPDALDSLSDAQPTTTASVPETADVQRQPVAEPVALTLGLPDRVNAAASTEPVAEVRLAVEPQPARTARVSTLPPSVTAGEPDDDLVALAPSHSRETPAQADSSWVADPIERASDAVAGMKRPPMPRIEPERLFPASIDVELPAAPADVADAYVQRTAAKKLDYVERQGGSEETEAAVAAALSWLARHQSEDGHWDGNGFDERCGECGGQTDIRVDHALTGLSLLCFLAAGHTHVADGPYRETVDKGVRWLTQHQRSDGDLRGDETMYSHGIASIALAEAFGMTGDAELRAPVEAAVRFIEHARNRTVGGWRYDPGQPGDTSVLGWQIMALKSARMGGIDVPWAAFDAARKWLDTVSRSSQRGLYAYRPGQDYTPSMTAEGMFVQQILGRGPSDPRMVQSARLVSDHLPDWDEEPNTYYWYYGTLAMFQHQGPEWERWNARLVEALLPNQRKGGGVDGSWDPVGEWAHVGGRVYQTAICTLMLEVYYRYLPMYAQSAVADAIGLIKGVVMDASTGRPLEGATVRLDLPDRPAVTAISKADGRYELAPPDMPAFFALSASREDYVPDAVNVATAMVMGTTLRLDFELEPTSGAVIAIEAVPEVHHLGDDAFSGRINSRFQRSAQGAVFTAEFTVDEAYLTRGDAAELTLLAKGVQADHRILINGNLLGDRLDSSPADGSFGEFTARFSRGLLVPGSNTLNILATSLGSDVDDFEFVNIRIRFER